MRSYSFLEVVPHRIQKDTLIPDYQHESRLHIHVVEHYDPHWDNRDNEDNGTLESDGKSESYVLKRFFESSKKVLGTRETCGTWQDMSKQNGT